jgi:hypothetical protein
MVPAAALAELHYQLRGKGARNEAISQDAIDKLGLQLYEELKAYWESKRVSNSFFSDCERDEHGWCSSGSVVDKAIKQAKQVAGDTYSHEHLDRAAQHMAQGERTETAAALLTAAGKFENAAPVSASKGKLLAAAAALRQAAGHADDQFAKRTVQEEPRSRVERAQQKLDKLPYRGSNPAGKRASISAEEVSQETDAAHPPMAGVLSHAPAKQAERAKDAALRKRPHEAAQYHTFAAGAHIIEAKLNGAGTEGHAAHMHASDVHVKAATKHGLSLDDARVLAEAYAKL